MGNEYITLNVTCCHVDCGKTFHYRLEMKTNEEGKTDQIVDCLHCEQPVKIRVPKGGGGSPVLIIRSAKPE